MLLILFPIVMLEIKFLSPLFEGHFATIGTFLCNALSVTLIAWPFMPACIRLLDWWLLPTGNQGRLNVLGGLLVLSLYALEIGVFIAFFGF